MLHESWCFPIWLVRASIFPSLVWAPNMMPPILLGSSFLGFKRFSHSWAVSALLKHEGGDLSQMTFFSLYAVLSSLLFFPGNSSQFSFPGISALAPEIGEFPELCPWFLLPILPPGKSKGRKMSHWNTHLSHFPFLKTHCFCCLVFSDLKTVLSYIFVCLFLVLIFLMIQSI